MYNKNEGITKNILHAAISCKPACLPAGMKDTVINIDYRNTELIVSKCGTHHI